MVPFEPMRFVVRIRDQRKIARLVERILQPAQIGVQNGSVMSITITPTMFER